MDGTRPQQPLTDWQLERELETALGVDPSPEFMARVRRRIAIEPEASPWRLAVVSGFSRTRQRLAVEPLWAVAIVGIALTVIGPLWMRDERPIASPVMVDVVLPAAEGTDLKVGPSGHRTAVESPPAGVQVSRSAARTRTRLDDTRSPEVLISRDEQRAFDALLAAIAQKQMPVRVVGAGEPEDGVVIPAVEIEPLTIEPLQLTRLE